MSPDSKSLLQPVVLCLQRHSELVEFPMENPQSQQMKQWNVHNVGELCQLLPAFIIDKVKGIWLLDHLCTALPTISSVILYFF
jgi:hypothetical protein